MLYFELETVLTCNNPETRGKHYPAQNSAMKLNHSPGRDTKIVILNGHVATTTPTRLETSFQLIQDGCHHRSLTLIFFLYLYTLYVVKGRTVTSLLHKLFLGEFHRYYSGNNLVRIPFE